MHPITQTTVALGVMVLVGMGAYALVYGVPTSEPELTSMDELKATVAKADETLCRIKLSRSPDELNERGRAERLRCLLRE